jgi:hypothetical protein
VFGGWADGGAGDSVAQPCALRYDLGVVLGGVKLVKVPFDWAIARIVDRTFSIELFGHHKLSNEVLKARSVVRFIIRGLLRDSG